MDTVDIYIYDMFLIWIWFRIVLGNLLIAERTPHFFVNMSKTYPKEMIRNGYLNGDGVHVSLSYPL